MVNAVLVGGDGVHVPHPAQAGDIKYRIASGGIKTNDFTTVGPSALIDNTNIDGRR